MVVVGLVIGSFLNVVVYRLPVIVGRDWQAQAREVLGLEPVPMEPFTLSRPASRCPCCGHAITARENIPVLSWLLLRGRCSGCRAPISKRYPLVEAACGLLSGVVAWRYGFTWEAGALLALTWVLLAASLIDADQRWLPTNLVLPLLWLGLIANQWGLFASPHDALMGAAAGGAALRGVYWALRLIAGRDVIGRSDYLMLALIGAWGGWKVLPLVCLLAVMAALFGGLVMRCLRQGSIDRWPLSPCLAASGWLVLLAIDRAEEVFTLLGITAAM
ncbi:prepilin peptidase [Geopseudomonas aromaticivorans]